MTSYEIRPSLSITNRRSMRKVHQSMDNVDANASGEMGEGNRQIMTEKPLKLRIPGSITRMNSSHVSLHDSGPTVLPNDDTSSYSDKSPLHPPPIGLPPKSPKPKSRRGRSRENRRPKPESSQSASHPRSSRSLSKSRSMLRLNGNTSTPLQNQDVTINLSSLMDATKSSKQGRLTKSASAGNLHEIGMTLNSNNEIKSKPQSFFQKAKNLVLDGLHATTKRARSRSKSKTRTKPAASAAPVKAQESEDPQDADVKNPEPKRISFHDSLGDPFQGKSPKVHEKSRSLRHLDPDSSNSSGTKPPRSRSSRDLLHNSSHAESRLHQSSSGLMSPRSRRRKRLERNLSLLDLKLESKRDLGVEKNDNSINISSPRKVRKSRSARNLSDDRAQPKSENLKVQDDNFESKPQKPRSRSDLLRKSSSFSGSRAKRRGSKLQEILRVESLIDFAELSEDLSSSSASLHMHKSDGYLLAKPSSSKRKPSSKREKRKTSTHGSGKPESKKNVLKESHKELRRSKSSDSALLNAERLCSNVDDVPHTPTRSQSINNILLKPKSKRSQVQNDKPVEARRSQSFNFDSMNSTDRLNKSDSKLVRSKSNLDYVPKSQSSKAFVELSHSKRKRSKSREKKLRESNSAQELGGQQNYRHRRKSDSKPSSSRKTISESKSSRNLKTKSRDNGVTKDQSVDAKDGRDLTQHNNSKPNRRKSKSRGLAKSNSLESLKDSKRRLEKKSSHTASTESNGMFEKMLQTRASTTIQSIARQFIARRNFQLLMQQRQDNQKNSQLADELVQMEKKLQKRTESIAEELRLLRQEQEVKREQIRTEYEEKLATLQVQPAATVESHDDESSQKLIKELQNEALKLVKERNVFETTSNEQRLDNAKIEKLNDDMSEMFKALQDFVVKKVADNKKFEEVEAKLLDYHLPKCQKDLDRGIVACEAETKYKEVYRNYLYSYALRLHNRAEYDVYQEIKSLILSCEQDLGVEPLELKEWTESTLQPGLVSYGIESPTAKRLQENDNSISEEQTNGFVSKEQRGSFESASCDASAVTERLANGNARLSLKSVKSLNVMEKISSGNASSIILEFEEEEVDSDEAFEDFANRSLDLSNKTEKLEDKSENEADDQFDQFVASFSFGDFSALGASGPTLTGGYSKTANPFDQSFAFTGKESTMYTADNDEFVSGNDSYAFFNASRAVGAEANWASVTHSLPNKAR